MGIFSGLPYSALSLFWCLSWLPGLSGAQSPRLPGFHGERVTLADGRHLALYCEGTRLPLVVLEAGYGSNSLAWRRLQPLLAKHNRVCSYDRAGERFSDPGPYPRDLNAMVTDLHALTSVAHFARPFVLVGHSMGGMTALLYTERYRSDVSALVMLDPGMPGMLKAYEALPHPAGGDHEVLDGLSQLQHCRNLASHPSQRADLLASCSWRDPQLSPQQNEEQNRMIEQPAFWETLLSTDLALRAPLTAYTGYLNRFSEHKEAPLGYILQPDETLDERELLLAERPLGALPLVVVSVKSSPPDGRAWAIKEHVYSAAVKKLSRRGAVIDMGNTSHNVQLDQPERTDAVILKAIQAAAKTQE